MHTDVPVTLTEYQMKEQSLLVALGCSAVISARTGVLALVSQQAALEAHMRLRIHEADQHGLTH